MALESDRQKPVEFGAEHFDGKISATGEVRLKGSFWLDQGTMKIRADQATVYRKDGAVVRVLIDGAPATVEQDLDEGGRMRAQALDIDYQIDSDTLLLSRQVRITQPEGTMQGERVRYDISSGQISGDGGATGSMRMRIEPKPPAAGN
jgi:lipopolysaccharide export system protein LptA